MEINKKSQSQDIFRLGSYKTWCSTRIHFRSFTFSSVCKWLIRNY